MENYCSACGAKLRTPNANFCFECGVKVTSSSSIISSEPVLEKVPQVAGKNASEAASFPASPSIKSINGPSSLCVHCQGSGFTNQTTQIPCSGCGGSGWIRKWNYPTTPVGKFPPKPPTMTTTACLSCNGRGFKEKITKIPCSACGGRGRQ